MDSQKGLTTEEVEKRLSRFGPNKISSETNSLLTKLSKILFSPITLMFLIAATLSYVGGKSFDFYFILFLMLLNISVSFWQERKADNAIEQLNKLLKLTVSVKRDGGWQDIDSEMLVPGDLVRLYIGDVVPADMKIVESRNLSVNEAAITGESLPVEKAYGDGLYSGSFIATGQAEASVETTGRRTYFGKILSSLDSKPKRSILEKDILSISKTLSLLSFVAVIVLSAVFVYNHQPILETLTLDLSLVIAGIPIALPTVLTLIISLGVLKLSKENVVVRRLASLEDLANVDLLFTDKTGTLTKNEIVISRIVAYGVAENDVLSFAFLASVSNDHDLINRTIIKRCKEADINLGDNIIKEFIPADSIRKRGTVIVDTRNGEICVSVGAPQIIVGLCDGGGLPSSRWDDDVRSAADEGYRVLAVAVNRQSPTEEKMDLVGLLYLTDELRSSARETINFLRENGVKVKMLTGDHRAIAKRIGAELGLEAKDVYSEVLPADKYDLVVEGKKDHIVAVTGDGVNDLPAVKTADVGFAVSNAVGALKSSADIVLLSSGISVITTAIIEARKIFARIHGYSVYRISESLRLIITILILGLIYRSYPLSPIQLILLAILNDIPIVSLAFNRVEIASKPAKIEVGKRFVISLLFGMTGVLNSIIFLFLSLDVFHLGWPVISTAFFLKLTVGGHLLVFVAHTEKRWYRFLPSKQVIWAVLVTQLVATILAVCGFFMTRISWQLAAFTWVWAILWMQIGDLMKDLRRSFIERSS